MENIRAIFFRPDPEVQVRRATEMDLTHFLFHSSLTKACEEKKMQRTSTLEHPKTRPRHCPAQRSGSQNKVLYLTSIQTSTAKSITSQAGSSGNTYFRTRTPSHTEAKCATGDKQGAAQQRTHASQRSLCRTED